MSRRHSLVAAAVAAVLLLTGCVVQAAPTPTPSRVAFPMPDLGAAPQTVPYTDAQAEQARIAAQDSAWAALQQQYPDAVRPAVDFTGFASEKDPYTKLFACFDERHVLYGKGTGTDG